MSEPKFTMVDELPDKLSDLIDLALKDEAAVHKSPLYEVDMSIWHEPFSSSGKKVCQVCLAGAVIAKHSNALITETIEPSNFEDDIANKLEALDHIRSGEIYSALYYLAIDVEDLVLPTSMPVEYYRESRLQFRKDLFAIRNKLREFDL